jgi:hypothetical protein
LLILLSLTACTAAPPVPLARYLEHAEIQAETDTQRAALRQAFEDMLSPATEKLRTARYGPDQRTLPALLRAHLVPLEPVAVEDEEFYTQARDARVQAAVEALRQQLRE